MESAGGLTPLGEGAADTGRCARMWPAIENEAEQHGPACERGHSGRDFDGHSWEIQFNPGWTVRDDGSTSLGGRGARPLTSQRACRPAIRWRMRLDVCDRR
jgi:hypothetical protein